MRRGSLRHAREEAHIEDWLAKLPVASMWGTERSAAEFEDTRLARSLDTLWGLGLDEVFAPLVVSWKSTWNLSFEHIHGLKGGKIECRILPASRPISKVRTTIPEINQGFPRSEKWSAFPVSKLKGPNTR